MEKSLEPSIITVLGTVVFRVIWLLTVFKMVPTYEMLMNVYVASWIFTGGVVVTHLSETHEEAGEESDKVVVEF